MFKAKLTFSETGKNVGRTHISFNKQDFVDVHFKFLNDFATDLLSNEMLSYKQNINLSIFLRPTSQF